MSELACGVDSWADMSSAESAASASSPVPPQSILVGGMFQPDEDDIDPPLPPADCVDLEASAEKVDSEMSHFRFVVAKVAGMKEYDERAIAPTANFVLNFNAQHIISSATSQLVDGQRQARAAGGCLEITETIRHCRAPGTVSSFRRAEPSRPERSRGLLAGQVDTTDCQEGCHSDPENSPPPASTGHGWSHDHTETCAHLAGAKSPAVGGGGLDGQQTVTETKQPMDGPQQHLLTPAYPGQERLLQHLPSDSSSPASRVAPSTGSLLPWICGLCRGFLTGPCTLVCGHTYCRQCLLDHAVDVAAAAAAAAVVKTTRSDGAVSGKQTPPPASKFEWSPSTTTTHSSATKPESSSSLRQPPMTPCPRGACVCAYDSARCSRNSLLAHTLDSWFPAVAKCAQLVRRIAVPHHHRRRHGNQSMDNNAVSAAATGANAVSVTAAIPLFKEAIALDSSNVDAHTGLSRCYVQAERAQEALAAANQACVLAPHNAKTYCCRAEALLLCGQFADAVRDVRHSARVSFIHGETDGGGGGGGVDERALHSTACRVTGKILHKWISARPAQTSGNMDDDDTDITVQDNEERLVRELRTAMESTGPADVSPLADTNRTEPFPAEKPPAALLTAEKPQADDVSCPLCFRLLYQPVTTPCGHTLCRMCLIRVMDTGLSCPQCRGSLEAFLGPHVVPVTECLEHLIRMYLPEQYEKRHQEHMAYLSEHNIKVINAQLSTVPIFIWMTLFPAVPVVLHVFEPRYRELVRQALRCGTRQFGVCQPINPDECEAGSTNSHSNIGTLVRITDVVQDFGDGRKLLDIVGVRRFKCVNQGNQFERDGYDRANVEWIEDSHPTNAQERAELVAFHNKVRDKTLTMLDHEALSMPLVATQAAHLRSIVARDVSPEEVFSADGPGWLWHCITSLPFTFRSTHHLELLASTSLSERLARIDEYLGRNMVPEHFSAYLLYRLSYCPPGSSSAHLE